MTFIEQYTFDILIYLSKYENRIQSKKYPKDKSLTVKLAVSDLPKLIYISYIANNKKNHFNKLIKDIKTQFIAERNTDNPEFKFLRFSTFFDKLKSYTYYTSKLDNDYLLSRESLKKLQQLNYNQFMFFNDNYDPRTSLLKHYYYEHSFEKYIPNFKYFQELKKLENIIFDNTFLFFKFNRKDIQRKIALIDKKGS
tara:strand:+ start:3559 stop:4146 length:588 start_codon:yes stop_codon:yes gene_type:complete